MLKNILMLSLQRLSKSFGRTKAIDDVSVEIQRGEIIGLLGPNGAGKTTFMRILAGVLEPEQGSYAFDGEDVFQEPLRVKRRLGYLAENNPLPDDMIVREYLEWIAELRLPKPERNSGVERAIAATELQTVSHRPIAELSKGFRQRVGLAQAMLSDPELLILDEPTEGLDPNQRVDLRTVIHGLGKNKTVLISTHVLSEVAELCSRLLIIDHGKVVADGSMATLQEQVKQQSRLTVEFQTDRVSEDAVLGVKGVLKILNKHTIGDRWTFTLGVDPREEVAPQLFQLAKQNGWTLWELHQEQMNLEQLFRHLTNAQ